MPDEPKQQPKPSDADTGREGKTAREVLDDAKKKARGVWSWLRPMVRTVLPKKWTPRNIAIAAIVIILLVVLISTAISMIVSTLKWVLVGGLVLAGLYFLLFAGKR